MDLYDNFTEKFAVVVPVYNEKDTILTTCVELEYNNIPYLVVDDGSTDGTSQMLYLKDVPHLTQYPNRGKGSSVIMGANALIKMGFEWILILDSDGQFTIDDISKFDEELLWYSDDYKMFVGNRMTNNSTMPKERLFANKFMSLVISKLSGVLVPDTQCGLKMCHKSLFTTLDLKAQRFDLDSELIIKAGRAGMNIKSVPVSCIYKEGRKSKMRPIRDFFRFIKVLLT